MRSTLALRPEYLTLNSNIQNGISLHIIVTAWGLRKPHIVVLLTLYKSDLLMFSDLCRALGTRRTPWVNAVLEELKEWGLITETRIKRFRIFTLTEKGRSLAEKLMEIFQPP